MEKLLPLVCFAVTAGSTLRLTLRLRRAGMQQWALPADESPQAWLGRAYKILIAAFGVLVLANAFDPRLFDSAFGSLPVFESPAANLAGAAMMVTGAGLIAWGQASLGLAWRVGLPENETPGLVVSGAYRYSRNPFFLGLLMSALGFAVLSAGSLPLVFLAALYVCLNVQIREEEGFLTRKIGAPYLKWLSASHRWFGMP